MIKRIKLKYLFVRRNDGSKSHNYLGVLDLYFDSNEYYFNKHQKQH